MSDAITLSLNPETAKIVIVALYCVLCIFPGIMAARKDFAKQVMFRNRSPNDYIAAIFVVVTAPFWVPFWLLGSLILYKA